MTGFTADWLALREPADHVARSGSVAAALRAHFAHRAAITVLDLGCGAGSNLRGTYQDLPQHQDWTLVDYDPALLVAARAELTGWADSATPDGDTLLLRKGAAELRVQFVQADLTTDLPSVLAVQPDLVTAAALFDLVSERWLATFTEALSAVRLPLYTVLTYDGLQQWQPPHPLDDTVVAGFNAHQRTDKGFGAAAGPRAVGILASSLRTAGYAISTGASPWQLAASPLLAELVAGIAASALEVRAVTDAQAAEWEAARHGAAVGSATIGHLDVLALPPAAG
ncbi:Methyltransferase domain protein [Arthrobacter ulcerisalmonis]|uniref:Methyltransferase domain protein n=1 Tax=Arthrobacter ulcerisalmonis TaxID=2483813 RepID=A0A3P5XL16_9MICC|nr:class I SAM-dependent methyltransferase [Arthrobacter ulcerisalmonis]VDC30918.1 Methyltransferase domain protein [Arthrobacter ulcerisalmonis]